MRSIRYPEIDRCLYDASSVTRTIPDIWMRVSSRLEYELNMFDIQPIVEIQQDMIEYYVAMRSVLYFDKTWRHK